MNSLLVTCEHAGHAVPAGVDLGLSDEVLRSQASWDHGALDVANAVAARFGREVFAGEFSRLFVDLNRPSDHPDVIPEWCYGAHVPTNATLSAQARRQRLDAVHAPHWRRVRAAIELEIGSGQRVVQLASHSFCTLLDPSNRKFDVGLLFDPSREGELALVDELEAACLAHGLSTRRNEPYTGIGPGVTSSMRVAFSASQYVGVTIETSHAVTMREGGCTHVASALAVGLAQFGIRTA